MEFNQYHVSFVTDNGRFGSLFYESENRGMELISNIRNFIQDQTHEYNFVILAISKV